MTLLDSSRSPGVLRVGPPPAGLPQTFWVYYIDPGAGTEGRVYVYAFDAAGAPVAAVDQVDVPVRPGLSTYGFSRESLIQYSCPNADGRLTLWDPSQTAGTTWMWTPGGILQGIEWVDDGFGGYIMTPPTYYPVDGYWYWAQQVASTSTQVQLYRTTSSFTSPEAVGSVQGPAIGSVNVLISGVDGPPALCPRGSVRYLDGSTPDSVSASSTLAKVVGVFDSVSGIGAAILPRSPTLDTQFIRRVKEDYTELIPGWPTTAPWGKTQNYAAVQPLTSTYLAMEQTATGMRLLIGPDDPVGDPDLELTLGAHPDHPGVYPALAMAVA